MKKLICAEDVEMLHGKGKQVIVIDKKTIITPSARDLAEEYQMTFEKSLSENITMLANPESISKDQLVLLLKKLLNEAGMFGFSEPLFEYEQHPSGLKVVRGSTIKLSPLSEQNENVRYQELLTTDDSKFELGILEINHDQFCEKDTLESVNYVIDGTLQVTIDKTSYNVHQGDILFVPRHASVNWSTPSKGTIFSGKLKMGG